MVRTSSSADFVGTLPTMSDAARALPTISTGNTLLVGDLARRTGKTVRALHLYEELGLLEPADRSKGGYRRYRSDAVTRVEWIARLQDTGLSLPDIRELLAGWNGGSSAPDSMLRLSEVYREKLAETRAQMIRLAALERELESSLAYLETCNTCEPVRTVHACSACDRHECESEAPLMVAGVTTPSTRRTVP
jgi:MerR family copper efflux transcriptional regulator